MDGEVGSFSLIVGVITVSALVEAGHLFRPREGNRRTVGALESNATRRNTGFD